jgi:hypothetical protein
MEEQLIEELGKLVDTLPLGRQQVIGSLTSLSHISVAPSMPVSVEWKWKVDTYRHQIGCSTCKSSPWVAFDEQVKRSTT